MSADAPGLFSVVIVTFDNEAEIDTCLKSVLAELQDESFEIIVVDNRSTDGTKQAVHARRAALDSEKRRLLLIENSTNVGFTQALNRGLRAATGAWIVVLNPDTDVIGGSLKTLRGVLCANSEVAVVAPQLLNPDGSVQPSCRRFPTHPDVLFTMTGLSAIFRRSRLLNGWRMGDFDHLDSRLVDQPQGACLMFSQETLETVGLWDERFTMFFSDVDWCRRVRETGKSILFVPLAKVVHYKGTSVFRQRAKMIWSSHRSFYLYFRKYSQNLFEKSLTQVIGVILFVTALVRIAFAVLTRRVLQG